MSTPLPLTPVATADLVDRYGAALRVCDVQFRRFGVPPAYAGPVRTVSCRDDNALVHQLVRTPGRHGVLVVDGGGSLHTTLFGDHMAQLAIDNGWAGVVVHGAVRDSAVLAGLPLGAKALGTNPRRSAKDGRGTVDVPVTFGGITFHPGDVPHADEDGIVLLPVDRES